MSNEISVYNRPPSNPQAAIATLKDLFIRQKAEIAKVAASHLDPERLAKIAVLAVSKDKKLMQCTPVSVLRACMQAASMGLEPGSSTGEAYLVPYKGECVLIVGYRGLIALARRSGHVLSIEARVVYSKDVWKYEITDERTVLRHVPSDDDDPGYPLRYYAIARLKDTPLPVIEVMSQSQINKIMLGSQSKGAWGPWKDHPVEMARKTLIRRIVKYLPLSVEFANALDREDRVEKGERQDGEIIDISESSDREPHAEIDVEPETPELLASPAQAKVTPAKAERKERATEPATAPKRTEAPPSNLDSLVKPKAGVSAMKRCDPCGAVEGSAHAAGCPSDPTQDQPYDDGDGDEIQGREPGSDG